MKPLQRPKGMSRRAVELERDIKRRDARVGTGARPKVKPHDGRDLRNVSKIGYERRPMHER